MSGDLFADGEARILDRGYRPYDGPRDRNQPMRTVMVQGIQRGLGFRRPVAAKVLPYLALAAAFLPAIVMVGMASMFRAGTDLDLDLVGYSDYFANISLAVVLLTALVAPDVFGNDHRDGMLGIYLSSRLTRGGYVVAKAAAVAAILGLITAGPQLLLLIANTVQGVGPDGPLDWLVVLGRILLTGVVVSALLTSLSVAVTVLARNRGIATAAIAVILLIVAGMFTGLASVSDVDLWRIFSVPDLMTALPAAIHGDRPELVDEMPTATAWFGLVVWVVGGAAVTRWQIGRTAVTR